MDIEWEDPRPKQSRGGRPRGMKNFTVDDVNRLLPMLKANPGVEALLYEEAPVGRQNSMIKAFPDLAFRVNYRGMPNGKVQIFVSYPLEVPDASQ